MLDGCPVADDAQLCASELASNAIRHTRTGRRSGKFQVLVWRGRASVCVAVLDDGSDSAQLEAAGTAGPLAESGHGLLTVQTLAAWWGHHGYRDGSARGTAVWFRLDGHRPAHHDRREPAHHHCLRVRPFCLSRDHWHWADQWPES